MLPYGRNYGIYIYIFFYCDRPSFSSSFARKTKNQLAIALVQFPEVLQSWEEASLSGRTSKLSQIFQIGKVFLCSIVVLLFYLPDREGLFVFCCCSVVLSSRSGRSFCVLLLFCCSIFPIGKVFLCSIVVVVLSSRSGRSFCVLLLSCCSIFPIGKVFLCSIVVVVLSSRSGRFLYL